MKSYIKNIILILLFICFSVSAFAQKEGYLGKRMIINYFCSYSPYIDKYNYNLDIGGGAFTSEGCQLNHNIQFDYIVSRKSFIGLGIATNKTGVKFNESYTRDYYDHSIDNPEYYFETFNLKGLAAVSGVRLDLTYSVNTSGDISPMGFHFKFGAFMQFSTIKDPLQYTDAYIGTESYEKLANKKSLTTIHTGLLLGGYYQRVWFGNFVYKFGIDLAFSNYSGLQNKLQGASTTYKNIFYSNTDKKTRYDCYKRGISRAIAERQFCANFFRVNIGIGYLF